MHTGAQGEVQCRELEPIGQYRQGPATLEKGVYKRSLNLASGTVRLHPSADVQMMQPAYQVAELVTE